MNPRCPHCKQYMGKRHVCKPKKPKSERTKRPASRRTLSANEIICPHCRFLYTRKMYDAHECEGHAPTAEHELKRMDYGIPVDPDTVHYIKLHIDRMPRKQMARALNMSKVKLNFLIVQEIGLKAEG